MAKSNTSILAFNRGIISRLGLARTDLARMQLSAETQTNWMPRVLGSMMLRPGFQYIGATRSNLAAIHIPFIYATDDTAIIELTNTVMRVRVNDEIITRPSVTSAVSNGTFGTDLTGWTDNDESGATSAWKTGGYMSLIGSGYGAAIREQAVTVSGGNVGVEHALRITIQNGPVTLRVGSSSATDNYIAETSLGTGIHSLAFTPSGNFYIQFSSTVTREVLVDSVAVESAADMTITTPWLAANLQDVRYDQSGDVIFVACDGFQQRRIERRAPRSWSIILYRTGDGPFRSENLTPTTLAPSALSGNVTLAASQPTFKSTHVGALFKVSSIGQATDNDMDDEGQNTDYIRVSGVGANRVFLITITGTWSATLTFQRAIGDPSGWVDVNTAVANYSGNFNDGLDNQIIYYRYAIKSGDYTSGTANVALTYSGGSITGISRVTAVASSVSASAEVLVPFGGTSASAIWSEGAWSDYRGWPTCVALHEGRLWWAGRDNVWGSVSDAFQSFASTLADETTIGDSSSISRTIGSGPVDVINWLSAGRRLFVGGQGAEKSAQSSSFEEPLTPTNFNIKTISTLGSAPVVPVNLDTSTIFVQKSRRRVYEIAQDAGSYDYTSNDLTGLVPDLAQSDIVSLGVQRQPDTRIHVATEDGTVNVLIMDKLENVVCWVQVETDGVVEEVVVLPGAAEDAVYYVVKRTVNGGTVRYLEKWAMESECRGSLLNKQADSFVVYDSTATATIAGLSHLEGEEVIAWADGLDLSAGSGEDQTTYTVASGSITLPSAVSKAVVGLPYKSQYKSRKLIEGAILGAGLTQRKRVDHIGLVLADTHARGLRYGADFETMDSLPLIEEYKTVDPDSIWTAYDQDSIEFPGEWSTDSRVCLEAHAPRPCTVLGMVISVDLHEKTKG